VGSLDHPALLLSGLPTDSPIIAFVEFGTVSQRPSLSSVKDEFMSLVYATN
jgi:hypothetical protein